MNQLGEHIEKVATGRNDDDDSDDEWGMGFFIDTMVMARVNDGKCTSVYAFE